MPRPRGRPRKPKRNVWKRHHKGISQNKKFGIAKSLGYSGFHCFKEKTSGFLTIGPSSPTDSTSPVLNNLLINGTNMPDAQWKFNINQIGDLANYQGLFQQFRITGVKIKFYPCHNSSMYPSVGTETPDLNTTEYDGGTATGITTRTRPSSPSDPGPNPIADANEVNTVSKCIPNLVWDYDSTVNAAPYPATFSKFLEHDPKFRRLTNPFSIYLKPKLRSDTASFTGAKDGEWCNLASVSAQNYNYTGLLMGGHNVESRTNVQFIMTYYFQCKNQS